jgi:DNA-nicking Smr family endonuclease
MPRRHPTQPRFDSSDDLLGEPLAGRIDLHGMSAAQAEAAVRSFIDTWRRREPGAVVLIITGKGKGSPDGAVLRPAIRTLLKTRLSGFVSDWALDDSEGAFRVRVR